MMPGVSLAARTATRTGNNSCRITRAPQGWFSASPAPARRHIAFLCTAAPQQRLRTQRDTEYRLLRRRLPISRRLLATQSARMSMSSTTTAGGGAAAPSSATGARKRAYIALGSNIGDRIGWIEQACNEMDRRGIHVRRTSSLWETEPMYVLEQDKFANGVCEVDTDLAPLALLDQLQDIERVLGRHKLIDKGPRNIDLDILLYMDGDHHQNSSSSAETTPTTSSSSILFHDERLTIPHAGMAEREFVLRPLSQIAPHIPIDPRKPWKLVQDYLNDLPPQPEPITTLTPLDNGGHVASAEDHPRPPPLYALRADRRTRVMAILNVTPDSFSDGGTHSAVGGADAAAALVDTVRGFVQAGAAVIDVGGQSTAPGRPQVSADEELSRVVPAIRLIRRHLREAAVAADRPAAPPPPPPVAISVDTYRAAVAEAAVAAGADMVNDISAGDMDPHMLSTVARLGVTVCLMHMRGTPATMSQLNDYSGGGSGGRGGSSTQTHNSDDIIQAVASELRARVAAAEAAGVRRWRIVLDPGLGFAKVGDQNIDVLRHLAELRASHGLDGLPWLVGSSRKSFIGRTTGVAAPAQRIWGTAATVAAAVQGGADIVRVHDVREMAQVVAMADAIWRY